MTVRQTTSACGRVLSITVDQDSLLPPARCFVGSVDAARPAAWSLLSFQQFVAGSLDAPATGCGLLGIVDPQINSFRPRGVRFSHSASTFASARTAA